MGSRMQRRLCQAQIDAIMRRRAQGELPEAIGSHYGISGDAVRGLIRRRRSRFAEICRNHGVNPETFKKPTTPSRGLGSRAIWTSSQIELLKTFFPSPVSVHKIAALTHHSYYAVNHKAAALGLARPACKRGRIQFERGGEPIHLSVRCSFERVVAWLTASGHRVTNGLRKGMYRLDNTGEMTSQQVVRFANDLGLWAFNPIKI